MNKRRPIVSKLDLQFSLEAAQAGTCAITWIKGLNTESGELRSLEYWLGHFEGLEARIDYLWSLQEKHEYTFYAKATKSE